MFDKLGFIANIVYWQPGRYARSSLALLFWLSVRAAGQVVLFLGLARTLGAEGYGAFIAPLAVVSFFPPLAICGASSIIVRNVVQKRGNVESQLGVCLALWLRTVFPLSVIAAIAAILFVPSSPAYCAVAILAASEIGASSLVEILARAEQSQNHIASFGGWTTGLILTRLLFFIIYISLAKPTTEGWIWTYSISSILYSVCLWRYAGKPMPENRPNSLSSLVKDGYPFAFASVSTRLQAEFNKPVLAQLSVASTGNFSAAQRVVDLASLPFIALQEALWPRIFANGNSYQIFILCFFLVGLAFAAGCILWWCSPLLAALLGEGFEETAKVLRWLAWLPAIQLVRNILGVFHSSSNNSRFITRGYIVGAFVSIILTPIMISQYAVHGAVWAMYITEVLIVSLQIPTQKNLGATKSNG